MPPDSNPHTPSSPPATNEATADAPDSSSTNVKDFPDLFGDDLPPAKHRSRGVWLIAGGLLLLVALGGWWSYRTWQKRNLDPVRVTIAPPTRTTLENRVDASGTVTLGNQQTLTAPEDVTVEAVLVSERQSVATGEVLLRLRDRNLEQQLDEQLIQESILQLDYQRQQEILAELQRNVQQAQERLAESRDLATAGYIPDDELENDRKALESAQSELRTAQVELQKQALERQKNQATIANLRARMADNNIVAPFNAVVLNINVSPGDGVPREGKLLTIGDPTKEMVQFNLMTLDAGKVSVNMPVRISMIGPNPQKYPGRVVSLAPQAVADDGNNSTQASVQALAQLNQPSRVLIPGSAVSVEIILEQQPDVLSLPLGTLHPEGGDLYVWVTDADGKARKRQVTTGMETLDAIEITSGLAATDQVIINAPPGQDLVEGLEVVPVGSGLNPGAATPSGSPP